ncbi:MAG: ABC transporter ATP-binding protein [Ignavibacteriales bacterium]|nr:MAG: ABC transporter ATP-binding protein [Ignavibacteriales bacterium]
MLTLQNLNKSYGNFTALDKLNLQINPGEFFGFLGPNGAGKTTTIKLISGLLRPTAGKIFIDGHDLDSKPDAAKYRLGYIPDQPFLYEKLTGREFLFFSGGLFNIPHHELQDRIERITETLRIGSWIDRRTETYSQGMKQRISIASSILHNPGLVLVDEPMVGLDPQSAKLVKETFQSLVENGSSVLMTTHSLNIAEEVCTRIGILKDGKLIFDGPREAFRDFQEKNFLSLEEFFLELVK